jgi:hypothetical protein
MTYYNHYRYQRNLKKMNPVQTELIIFKAPNLFLKCPLQRVHFIIECDF